MPSKFFAILLTASIALVSCGSKIPKNSPCTIFAPADLSPIDWKCLCSVENSDVGVEKPLHECDGYIAWSKQDVERIFTYIRQLEGRDKPSSWGD